MRIWVASSDYRDDVRLSKKILTDRAEGYRKIRNTMRYALSNLYDFGPAKDAVAESDLLPLDQWALSKLDALLTTVKRAYETYEFHVVYHSIIDFCATDLSAIYFDIQKDNLYTGKKTGHARRSAQTVMYRIAHDVLIALAPITSFTSEEAWESLPGRETSSIFLATFPAPKGVENEARVRDYDAIFEVRKGVLPLLEAARRDKLIGKSLEARVVLTATGPTADLLARYRTALPELFIVSQVELTEVASDKAQAMGALKAEVLPATGNKCPRCWAFRAEVAAAQSLCNRCTEAVG